MIVHYMDFQVNQISVYRTKLGFSIQSVFDDANKNREEILCELNGRAERLSYDNSSDIDSEENRDAVASFERWMKTLANNRNHSIEEGDIWIAFFSEEVESKVHFLEFYVNMVVVESTQFYDTAWGAIAEAVRRREEILSVLGCYTKEIVFKDDLPDDAPENRDAVERFDYWMSDFALFQFHSNCIEEDELTVSLLCCDVFHQPDPFTEETEE